MSFDFPIVVMYTTQVFICVTGFIGQRRYTHLTSPLKILEWYIIYSIIEDIVVDIMIFKKVHTYFLGQCYNVIELLLFSGIFYAWRTSRRNGFLIWLGFLIFLFIWIVGKFTFEPITGWDNYSGLVTQIIQIGFGSWLLLGILKESDTVLKDNARFWVLSGIVLYAVGTFFFFGLFTPMLVSNRKLLRAIWPLNDVFIVIQYFFFLRAFLCKSSPTSKNLVSNGTMNSLY